MSRGELQRFALLAVAVHGVERGLEQAARGVQLGALHVAALAGLLLLGAVALVAQQHLFQARVAGAERGTRLGVARGRGAQLLLLLQHPGLELAQFLARALQRLQQHGLALACGVHRGLEPGELAAALDHAGARIGIAREPQPVAAEPDALGRDHRLARREPALQRQRLRQRVRDENPGQQSADVEWRAHLRREALRHRHGARRGARAEQPQRAGAEALQRRAQRIHVVHAHRLQVAAEHGFHRGLPAGIHGQALGHALVARYALRLQPAGDDLVGLSQRGLLQRLQRGEAPALLLQRAAHLVELPGELRDARARHVDLLAHRVGALLPAVADLLELLHARVQRLALRLDGRGVELGRLVLQPFQALLRLRQRFLEMADARLLHADFLARLLGGRAELLPLELPLLHGLVGQRQRLLPARLGGLGLGERRHHLLELGAEAREPGLVVAQVALGLLARAPRLLEIRAQLPRTFLLQLHRLFGARDIGADGVVALLHPAERLVQPGMLVARLLDVGIHARVPGVDRRELDFAAQHALAQPRALGIELAPLQGQQLGGDAPLLGLQLRVALGGRRPGA